MSSFKYFDYTFDNSFEAKFRALSWLRTEGVERQLCELLSSSRNAPITQSQVIVLTRWPKQDVKRWFAVLLSSGVFVDDPTSHLYRWRLSHHFPTDLASLSALIPPVGSTIVSRTRPGHQSKSISQSATLFETIPSVNEDDCLPRPGIDDSDDFFSVFSRMQARDQPILNPTG